MKKLKYQGFSITFQEVPDEVSLVFNVSGCSHHCEGCHSPNLWEYEGNYLADDYHDTLLKYKSYVTAVCFMGGEQSPDELAIYVDEAHQNGLKVCLYSGNDTLDSISGTLDLDYLKIGHYDAAKGGLSSPTTNQRFYKMGDLGWYDISDRFHEMRCEQSCQK